MLDLDETLVCAYHRKEVPEHLIDCSANSFALTYNLGNGRLGDVVVFPRPGVRTFLQVLSGFCELIVFTAGHPGTRYAWPASVIQLKGGYHMYMLPYFWNIAAMQTCT